MLKLEVVDDEVVNGCGADVATREDPPSEIVDGIDATLVYDTEVLVVVEAHVFTEAR